MEFLSLIEEKLKKPNIKFKYKFVNDYDRNNIDRAITLFEKPLEYEYQKTFRLYLEHPVEEPFVFRIGSLTKIAEIHRTKDIIDTLAIKLNKTH